MFIPCIVFAQVYKCADDRQQTVYQDAPCPPGRELRNFAVDPPPVSMVPFRAVPGTTSRVAAPAPDRARSATARDHKDPARAGDPMERRHVHPGMGEGEVMARLGPPDMKSGGGSRKAARWSYLPVAGDPQTLTTVLFEHGQVVEVERKVVR